MNIRRLKQLNGIERGWHAGDDTFVDEAETNPAGNDEVHGGARDDRFYGVGVDEAGIRARAVTDQSSVGDDTIVATKFDDILNGGAGNDTFTGGSGADLIELDFGDGIDTMSDFEDGIDIIDLSETGLAFGDLTITDGADGVHITYETDAGGVAIGELTFTGITADVLSQEDFQFG